MKKIIIILLSIFSFINVYAITPGELLNKTNDLEAKVEKDSNLSYKYPIGSILITNNNKNPSSTLGGTWERYSNGRKLISVDSNNGNYNKADLQGGSNSTSLNWNTMPSHNHGFTPSGSVSSSFGGNTVTSNYAGDHNHYFSFQQTTAEKWGDRVFDTYYNYKGAFNGTSYLFGGRIAVDTPNLSYTSSQSEQFWATPSGSVGSSFSGSQVTTSSVGSGASFDIKNPYQTVYIWRRTA